MVNDYKIKKGTLQKLLNAHYQREAVDRQVWFDSLWILVHVAGYLLQSAGNRHLRAKLSQDNHFLVPRRFEPVLSSHKHYFVKLYQKKTVSLIFFFLWIFERRRLTIFGKTIFNFNNSWLISIQQQTQNVIICQPNRWNAVNLMNPISWR